MSLSLRAWLCVAVALAAALRLPTLDVQSLWADEAVTASVTNGSLGHLFSAVWNGESTPPLFYLLQWPIIKLLGDGEAALRLLPALFSIATVPVIGAIGALIAGNGRARSSGAIAALLCATNPLLVWFGQEARSYSLLALLSAASLLLMLRAIERPGRGRLAAWAVVAILALATHWFAIFLLAGESVWLALRLGRRAVPPLAALAVAAAASLPLLLHQRGKGLASFIGDSSLLGRIAELPKQLLVGYDAPLEVAATIVIAALVVGAVGVAPRTTWNERTASLVAVAAMALILPLAATIVGQDYVITRNMLPALVIAVPLAACAFAALGKPGIVITATICVIWTALVIGVAADRSYQRDDWRSAIASLSPASKPRLVIVTPASGTPAAEYYLGRTHPMAAQSVVTQVALVAIGAHDPGDARPLPMLPAPPTGLFTHDASGATWTSRLSAPNRPVTVITAAVPGWGGPAATGLIED